MDRSSVSSAVAGMRLDSESARKMTAFHLKTSLADQDTVDAFVREGGMQPLRNMVLRENGNTLAYALESLNRILELDYGWDQIDIEVAERVVRLVIDRTVTNVLRNAFRFLVLIVTRPAEQLEYPLQSPCGAGVPLSIDTLKPILKEHADFLEALVAQLTSPDHGLCANALAFLNALVRDGISTFSESQLMRFVKKLQELKVFGTVEALMRDDSLEGIVEPLLEFQNLTKVLLRYWRMVQVDLSRPAHAQALAHVQKSAARALPDKLVPSRKEEKQPETNGDKTVTNGDTSGQIPWTTLGFSSGDPAHDFQDMGLLGLMDLTDFVSKNEDFFHKTLLEQSVQPEAERCPIARVSVTVTAALHEHFSINDDESEAELSSQTVLPLLLSRDLLHGAITHAFVRLWAATGATLPEFDKIETLARLLVTHVVGAAPRRSPSAAVAASIAAISLQQLRALQLQDLDRLTETAWGGDLIDLRVDLRAQATAFVREQRIRCLVQGAWFPALLSAEERIMVAHANGGGGGGGGGGDATPHGQAWRFVQLAPSRRHLHHAAFAVKTRSKPAIADMQLRIDVGHISSVVSNVVTNDRTGGGAAATATTTTQLMIRGEGRTEGDETTLLELRTGSASVASEWLDGLLLLLDQKPITKETVRMVGLIEEWSLKVRLLGLGWDDVDWDKVGGEAAGVGEGGKGRRWDREGVDDDYWYDMGEGR